MSTKVSPPLELGLSIEPRIPADSYEERSFMPSDLALLDMINFSKRLNNLPQIRSLEEVATLKDLVWNVKARIPLYPGPNSVVTIMFTILENEKERVCGLDYKYSDVMAQPENPAGAMIKK